MRKEKATRDPSADKPQVDAHTAVMLSPKRLLARADLEPAE